VLKALGGDDAVDATGLLAGAPALTTDLGAGSDRMLGSGAKDIVLGGDGDDFTDPNKGDDVGAMGAGDDTFQWDPGDGNDTIEGQAGTRDQMLFNGAAINDTVDVSANGGRVKFFRDPGAVTMDLDDVENIRFNALAGTDVINVGDLSSTDMKVIDNDLATDGAADRVVATGTPGSDSVTVAGDAAKTTVSGLPATVNVLGGEPLDSLVINTLGGNDSVDATGLLAGAPALTTDLGAGNDRMLGSGAKDTVLGGDGEDFADPNKGDDLGLMGAGDDTFQWDPGDGNDTIEGQAGTRDQLLFNGANVAENIDISANGERSLFFRDVAAVTMDMDRVERIEFNALGGMDQIVVNDLRGTDVRLVDLDLAGVIGSGIGDNVTDRVTVEGTGARDLIAVRTLGGATVVGGLSARVVIAGEDAGRDVLTIEAGGGNDRISAALLTDDGMKLVVRGGSGNDVIRGGEGRDELFGNSGRDQIFGALGNDELTGGSAADKFIFAGQNGTDHITDFRDGVDTIQIRGYGSALNSFADLAGDIVQVGNDVRINLGANVSGAGRIIVENITVAQLSAADFDF
jgi:Ca2+-binding RTX toxin-like protein